VEFVTILCGLNVSRFSTKDRESNFKKVTQKYPVQGLPSWHIDKVTRANGMGRSLSMLRKSAQRNTHFYSFFRFSADFERRIIGILEVRKDTVSPFVKRKKYFVADGFIILKKEDSFLTN